jgi:hypothetical protein
MRKMKLRLLYLLISVSFVFANCKNEEEEVLTGCTAPVECKANPAFINATGIDPRMAAFTTVGTKTMGLVLREMRANVPADSQKVFQHPSWKAAGSLGTMAFDAQGNIYVIPIPSITLLYNEKKAQNTIYKVDSRTQEMKPFIQLPIKDVNSPENPFGLLGLIYDCETQMLYASTVFNSDRKKEAGTIYCIETKDETPKIIDQLDAVDAIGLGIATLNEKKRLFLGLARSSKLLSVQLNEKGKFVSELREELSLQNEGPSGDDRVRKIRFSKQGDMLVSGVEFYFNLIAPAEKKETVYNYQYNMNEGKWVLKGMQ